MSLPFLVAGVFGVFVDFDVIIYMLPSSDTNCVERIGSDLERERAGRVTQLSGVAAAGTENRMGKVHTLQLEGYRKFDFMLLRAHAAPS